MRTEVGAQPVSPAPAGWIGPNAILRVAEALLEAKGGQVQRDVFASAVLGHYVGVPLHAMVDEMDVARLQLALVQRLGVAEAARISRTAGHLTGDYLLANRIPAFAQTALGLLPRAVAARALTAAIARHAWTFAGSGRFSYAFGPLLHLRLEHSPLCRLLQLPAPACHYFTGTFERVYGAILRTRVVVDELACGATGAPACVFEVRWK